MISEKLLFSATLQTVPMKIVFDLLLCSTGQEPLTFTSSINESINERVVRTKRHYTNITVALLNSIVLHDYGGRNKATHPAMVTTATIQLRNESFPLKAVGDRIMLDQLIRHNL